MPYERVTFKDRDREFNRLLTLGWKPKEVMEHLGMCSATYHRNASSKIIKEDRDRLQDIREDMIFGELEELDKLIPAAVQVYREQLDNGENPMLQFKAANEVLDRTGIAKITKHENRTLEVRANADDIRELVDRARKAQEERDNAQRDKSLDFKDGDNPTDGSR